MAEDVTWRLGRNQEEMETKDTSLEQKKGEKRGWIDYQQEGIMDGKEEEVGTARVTRGITGGTECIIFDVDV